MEADEHGLTCETCYFARRLEAVAFARLLRLPWYVLGEVDLFGSIFFRLIFIFECGRPAASVRPPCPIYLFTTCVFCHERQRPPARNA